MQIHLRRVYAKTTERIYFPACVDGHK